MQSTTRSAQMQARLRSAYVSVKEQFTNLVEDEILFLLSEDFGFELAIYFQKFGSSWFDGDRVYLYLRFSIDQRDYGQVLARMLTGGSETLQKNIGDIVTLKIDDPRQVRLVLLIMHGFLGGNRAKKINALIPILNDQLGDDIPYLPTHSRLKDDSEQYED